MFQVEGYMDVIDLSCVAIWKYHIKFYQFAQKGNNKSHLDVFIHTFMKNISQLQINSWSMHSLSIHS